MSQQAYLENTGPSEAYIGKSSLGFLRDCYARIVAAENYARKLERNLYEAQMTAYQGQLALAECEKSRASSLEALNNERAQHRACQEALSSEIWKHRETVNLLDRIYKEAFRNAEVAESLTHEIAAIENSQRTPDPNSFPMQISQSTISPAECDASTTVGRQSHSIQRIINHG